MMIMMMIVIVLLPFVDGVLSQHWITLNVGHLA